jgi:hypothetical protein
MTTIWEKLAEAWRLCNPLIDREKLDQDIDNNMAQVKKVMETSKPVPSAWDEINSEDDDDNDW